MATATSVSTELRTSAQYASFGLYSADKAHAYYPNDIRQNRYGQICCEFDGIDLNAVDISSIVFSVTDEMPSTQYREVQFYAISGNDDGRVISAATNIDEIMGTFIATVPVAQGVSTQYNLGFSGTLFNNALDKIKTYLARFDNPTHLNFVLLCIAATSTNYGVRFTNATATITYQPKKTASIPSFEQNGVSVSTVAKGSTVKINTNRQSATMTHTLYYLNGGTQVTIGSGVGASTNWTVPTTLGDSVTVYCTTYDGGVQIGDTQSALLVLTQQSGSGEPTINSVSVSDVETAIYTKFGSYVRGKSRLVVDINATAATGTPITGYRTTIDGQTYTGQRITTMPLMVAGARTLTVSVTGSTGDVATKTQTVNVLDYANPTLSSFSVMRCDDDGDPDPAGEYVKLTAAGAVSSMSGRNDISAVLKFRLSGSDDDWDEIEGTALTVSGYDLDLDGAVLNLGLDPSETAYDFRIELADYFTTISQQTGTEHKYPLLEFIKNQYAKFHVPVHLPDDSPLAVAYGGTGETSLEPLIQTIIGRIPAVEIEVGTNYAILGNSLAVVWGTATMYSFQTNGSATINFSSVLPDGKTFSAAPIVFATPKWSLASTTNTIVSTYVQAVSDTATTICMVSNRAMGITGSEYFNWVAIGTLTT